MACALALLTLSACGRRDDASGELPPLQEKSLPSHEGTRVVAPLGATRPTQVALVFVGEARGCDDWTPAQNGGRFLLCTHVEPSGAGAAARETLRELKKAYGPHVAKPPVLLVADASRAELARELLVSEPAFFAQVIVETSSLEPFDNIALSTFGERGGRALAVVTEDTAGLDRLLAAVRRLPLRFESIPPGPRARARALSWVGRSAGAVPPGAPAQD